MPFYDNTILTVATDERLLYKEAGNVLTVNYFRHIDRSEVVANTTVELHRILSFPFNRKRYSILNCQFKQETFYAITGAAGPVILSSENVFFRPLTELNLVLGTSEELYNTTIGSAPGGFINNIEIPLLHACDFTVSPALSYRNFAPINTSFPGVIESRFQTNFFTMGFTYTNCPGDNTEFEALLLSAAAVSIPVAVSAVRQQVSISLFLTIGLY